MIASESHHFPSVTVVSDKDRQRVVVGEPDRQGAKQPPQVTLAEGAGHLYMETCGVTTLTGSPTGQHHVGDS